MMDRTCPTCGKPVAGGLGKRRQGSYFPFCSERCRLVDLGAWLDCAYVIHSSMEAGQSEDAIGPAAEPGN
ncbi:MAG TPA: DNA gyrase inhibitor YacG [Phycisphaerales bacterium]|nr:DNA gyrase inhibitor YacG [Phycisphaerales bacterium]